MTLKLFMRGQSVVIVSRGFTINSGKIVYTRCEYNEQHDNYRCYTRNGDFSTRRPTDEIRLSR